MRVTESRELETFARRGVKNILEVPKGVHLNGHNEGRAGDADAGVTATTLRWPRQEGATAGDYQANGPHLVPPHRGREAPTRAMRASRHLSDGTLDEVRSENEELVEGVERRAAIVEELEGRLDELRGRLAER